MSVLGMVESKKKKKNKKKKEKRGGRRKATNRENKENTEHLGSREGKEKEVTLPVHRLVKKKGKGSRLELQLGSLPYEERNCMKDWGIVNRPKRNRREKKESGLRMTI